MKNEINKEINIQTDERREDERKDVDRKYPRIDLQTGWTVEIECLHVKTWKNEDRRAEERSSEMIDTR